MYLAFLIFLGGGLGSLARYLFSIAFNQATWPWGTMWSNIISCLILGFFMGMAHKTIVSDPYRIFFMTGFCGGFSTFSTYSGEIVTLYEGGAHYHATGYMLVSVLSGLLAIVAGMSLAKFLD